MSTSSEWTRKRLYPACARMRSRSSRVVIRIGSTILILKGSMIVFIKAASDSFPFLNGGTTGRIFLSECSGPSRTRKMRSLWSAQAMLAPKSGSMAAALQKLPLSTLFFTNGESAREACVGRFPDSFKKEMGEPCSGESFYFRVAKAVRQVIVHHPHRLHEGVADGRAGEGKPLLLQVLAQGV